MYQSYNRGLLHLHNWRVVSPSAIRSDELQIPLTEVEVTEPEKDTRTRKGMSTELESTEVAKDTNSTYFKDGKRRVDFVLVYEDRKDDTEGRLKRLDFENQLLNEGLDFEHDAPGPGDDSPRLGCIKIHAPWETLCQSAEILQMRLPVKCSDWVVGDGQSGCSKLLCKFGCCSLGAYEKALLVPAPQYITAPFDLSRMEQFLMEDYYHPDSFFTHLQRTRIVWDILQRANINDVRDIVRHRDVATTAGAYGLDSLPSTYESELPKQRGIQWLLKDKVYLAAFPLHDGDFEVSKPGSATSTTDLSDGTAKSSSVTSASSFKWSDRQILRYTWAGFGHIVKPQPLDAIRQYYGEHVAFYFAWLGFYTEMLIYPSVAGVLCFIVSLVLAGESNMVKETCQKDAAPGNTTMCPVCTPPNCDEWILYHSCTSAWWGAVFDNGSTVFMSIFTVFWASIFQEMWKRREAELAFRWDAIEPERVEEEVRPEFEARSPYMHVNPVTKETEPYVPWHRKLLWISGSISALLFLILCVVTALVALIVVRIALYGLLKAMGGIFDRQRMDIASWAINGLTFAVVMALGWFYGLAAHRLTELECPRTQEDYLASYIWKVFIFELLNNFVPVLYVAFLKGRGINNPSQQNYLLEMCDPGGCLNEVVGTVAILLLFRLVVSNAAELGIPLVMRHQQPESAELPAGDVRPGRLSERGGGHSGHSAAVPTGGINNPSQQNYLLEMCDPGGCLNEVVGTVAILLLFRLVVSNAAELGVPFVMRLIKSRRKATVSMEERVSRLMSRWRKDYGLSEPDMDGVYAEYLEMMVQFGFVTLFVPAFPLIPLICLVNNLLEVRLDAINFVTAYRRPLPERVSGIKIWSQCLSTITKLAVLCNAGLIAFTSDLIPLWIYQYSTPTNTDKGYISYRLSYFNMSHWQPEGEYLLEKNVTECWYPGYNEPTYPYDSTKMWWKIMTFRLLFFLAFTIVFYYFQWLCDFLIPDVPQAVRMRMDRASHLAKQYLYLNNTSRAESRLSVKRHISRKETKSLPELNGTKPPHIHMSRMDVNLQLPKPKTKSS